MTKAELRTATKQALGNVSSTTVTDTWYDSRVYSAYRRLCTFQGQVTRPGSVQPQFRVLRFYELEQRSSRALNTSLAENFVTPNSSNVFSILDIYDRTNDVPLRRMSRREWLALDPDDTGTPTRWHPGGKSGYMGYYIDKRPSAGDGSEDITVYEYTYQYPATLTLDTTEPIIPLEWHPAIWYGAVAEGAQLLDDSEKAAEYEALFIKFIAERKTPHEEAMTGYSGGRRYIPIGRN